MNLIYASVGDYLTLESQQNIQLWQALCHIVEPMPFRRLVSYLRFSPSSALAQVDAIVCAADTDQIAWGGDLDPILTFPLERALALAEDVRGLPDTCAMRDGRKWRSLPFIILCHSWDLGSAQAARTHARIFPMFHPAQALRLLQTQVDDYHDRLLESYRNAGILVRFQGGRAQIGPALRRKNPNLETEYYYPPADRRSNRDWLTVKRDNEGLRSDVELFQMLLDRNASETEMHRFFEQNPAILMEARMGIPISHRPNFVRPRDNRPDFVFTPILGPLDDADAAEVLELKSPSDGILTKGFHRGFTARVHRAVDQVRDYYRYMRDPANVDAIVRALGYFPRESRLAVLIGRSPRGGGDQEAFVQRQRDLDVRVVTYDDIFATQANQLSQRPVYRLISE